MVSKCLSKPQSLRHLFHIGTHKILELKQVVIPAIFQALDKQTTQPKKVSLIFLSFCGLTKGISQKICSVSVIINKRSFEFLVFGSCFRTLAVILVSDYYYHYYDYYSSRLSYAITYVKWGEAVSMTSYVRLQGRKSRRVKFIRVYKTRNRIALAYQLVFTILNSGLA